MVCVSLVASSRLAHPGQTHPYALPTCQEWVVCVIVIVLKDASHFDSRLGEFFRHARLSGSDWVRGNPVLLVLVGVVADLPCYEIRPRDAMVRLPDQTNVPLAGAPWAGLGDVGYPIMMTDSKTDMEPLPDWSWMLKYILGAPRSMIYVE